MPTEKQIAAQLKKEQAQVKRDTISMVMEAVFSLLHESQLHGSKLWPKNGFISGHITNDKLDIITVNVRILDDCDYKKVRFNIWGKERRVLKQRRQLVLIFDQALYGGIYFYPEYPEYINELCCHYHDDCIMDMLDFKFTIDN